MAMPVKKELSVLTSCYPNLRFRGCDPGLLQRLATHLRPMLFLPGDYVCRKGDVGKEMFIVNSGQVQVVGGPNDSLVFVTLKPGT